MKIYRHYYFDPLNDDFANTNINSKITPKDYKYLPKNIFYRIFKPVVYYLLAPIVVLIETIILRVKIKNKQSLKAMKKRKEGYFIYGNHTSKLNDAFSAPTISFPRQCYVITHPDVISIKGIKWLVRCLGVLPIPYSLKNYSSFLNALESIYFSGKVISIYPEAHIWPKYPEIRDFPCTSFYYPVKLNAPSYAKTTVYKKTKSGKTRPVVFIDGPFYPNQELSQKEAQKDLRDRIYQQMVKRTKEENSSYDIRHEYIKVDSPDKVRTEIVNLEKE